MRLCFIIILTASYGCLSMQNKSPKSIVDSKPSSIAVGKDETIVFDEDDMLYQTVISTYFRSAPANAHRIKPYLRRAAAQSSDSPSESRLHDIVTIATNEALESQQKEINRRWTKKKSAYCAAISGICSSVITAGVALLIHFNK